MAGEMSGHIFLLMIIMDLMTDYLRLLKCLSTCQNRISSVANSRGHSVLYVTPTIQVKTTDEDKYRVVEAITKEFKDEGYKVVDINGARVYIDGGWGLVRASSNTPTLVLRFEAKTNEQLEKIKTIFKQKLGKFPEVSQEWDTSGH